MDVEEYLRKLKLTNASLSAEFLRNIHRQHKYQIPFENLDMHYHNPIVLDHNLIFQKIITKNRGGYGIELNAIFYQFLKELGFDARLVACYNYEKGGEFGHSPEHIAVLVELENQFYLADVGLENGFIDPKPLSEHLTLLDYNKYFRFSMQDEFWVLETSSDASHFRPIYQFMQLEVPLVSFIDLNDKIQQNPHEHGQGVKRIIKMGLYSRIELTDQFLKTLAKGEESDIQISNEDMFLSKLEQHFGISYWDLTGLTPQT
ncbi:MAG: arylamine N-acetyltransferase [Cyclobacteriaceae bacterium]